jgi:hypothetical protein
MIRYRSHMTVTLGRFRDALKWAHAINADAKKYGWAESKVLTRVIGPSQELILESEYVDLAAFDKERLEFMTSAEAMATLRSSIEFNAPGTLPWDELEMSIDDIGLA